MGPSGRTVAIDLTNDSKNPLEVNPQPIVTKDGVTVVQNINFLGHLS